MIERFAAGDSAALKRPGGRDDPALLEAVRAIVEDVRRRGWDALVEHALRLDGAAPELVAMRCPASIETVKKVRLSGAAILSEQRPKPSFATSSKRRSA